MNKEELVARVADNTGQSKQAAREVLEAFLDVVGESLGEGQNIELRGFGSFKVKSRRERVARNPQTGEKVEVPRRFVPVFKASSALSGKLADK